MPSPDYTEIPVAIVILNWNNLEWTPKCLASLRDLDYPACRILVVDNGSEDGSPEIVERDFPEATLLRAGENLGVGGGRNLGAEYVFREWPESQYLLFLDNDARPAPDALKRLVDACETNRQIGVCSGKMYYMDEPDVVWSCGGDVLLHRADVHLIGMGQRDTGQFEQSLHVDMVAGAAFFVRRKTWKLVGPFDPAFGLYFCEDTDWCLRATKADWECRYIPEAIFWHKVSKSAPGKRYWYLKGRNNYLLLKKHGTGYDHAVFPLFMALGLVKATVREAARGNIGGIWAMLKGGVNALRVKR